MKVGVVGVGWAGQQHIKAYAAMEGVSLIGIAGLEEETREELAAEFSVPHSVARWEDLLEVDGLEAISVAVPTFLHAPIAIAALQRGIHVLSEKPIALDGAQAATMVAAARDAGRVLQVAFNHRRRGDVKKLRSLIEEGRLGRPYYTKAWWLRRTGIPTLGSWFTQSSLAGGGPLVDIGVHVLDYALFLLGNPSVKSVSASTYDLLGTNGFGGSPESSKSGAGGDFDVEDLATVFMRLDDGGTLLLEASWAMHRADGDQFGATVYGTEGGAEWSVDDYVPVGSLKLFGDIDGRATAQSFRADVGGAHAEVVADFVAVVRSGEWAGHDGSAAAALARVVDAAYLSAREQREVAL
nr:Gfo/Idh/MocA family oxidoreductase [Solirubrobacter soli]